MNKENGSKNLILGFLAGGAIGAVIALLYAPKSGKELRNDIKVKSEEFAGEAEKLMGQAREKAKSLIEEGKRKSEQMISDAKVKSENIVKGAEQVLSSAKEKTSGFVSSSKDSISTEAERLKTAFTAGKEAYKDTKGSDNSNSAV